MSLRNFLDIMEEKGEILHIKETLSPKYDLSALMQAFDNGPILYFHKIKGYTTRIVANVCSTRQRLRNALNTKPEQLYETLLQSWTSPTPPKIVSDGPVKENITTKVDLSKIPILTHFEKDAGPYITSAIVHAKSHDDKIENVSIHRLQVLDKNRLAIRLVPRHLYNLWRKAKEVGKDLEVAITIGLHPTIMLAASSPVSFGINEFAVANHLLNNKLKLTKCEHVDAYTPTEAELVLEGIISTREENIEGPLVDITGTYDIQRNQPVVKIVGLMHRNDYLYQALLPSSTEHKLLMGFPHEALIWKNVSQTVPKVTAVNLSQGGCGWLHAIIAIEKQTEGDPKNALLAAFAAHPSLKHAVVVDSDINIYNTEEVEWAIATRFQANEDLIIIPNARGSTLDPSADQQNGTTTKVGIDATKPLNRPREKFEKAKIPTSKEANKAIENYKKFKP